MYSLKIKDLMVNLVLCAYLLSALNFRAIGEIRWAEIVFLIPAFSIFYNNLKMKAFLTATGCYIFFVLLFIISNITGLVIGCDQTVYLYAFSYKYLFILLVVSAGIYIGNCNEKIIINFYKVTFYTLFFLILWALFYFFFLGDITSQAIAARVSFPTISYKLSDAHLYSFCLSILLIFYFLVMRVKLMHAKSLSLFIFFAGIFALFLTGSRTGLFNILFFIGAVIVRLILNRKINYTFVLLITLPFFLLAIFYLVSDEGLLHLFSRAITLNNNDLSALGRINKLQIGYNDYLKGPLIFGVGAIGSSLTWYDGILTILLVHFGPLGVIGFFSIPLLIYYKFSAIVIPEGARVNVAVLLFLLYFSNLVTEYILVSRGAMLTLLPITTYISGIFTRKVI